MALAQGLLLVQKDLDLGLLLLAVPSSGVLVLLLLAGAAVVGRARVGLRARRHAPLLVGGGRARGGGRRGAGRVAGAVRERHRRGQLRGAVAHELLDGLQLGVVVGQRRGRGEGPVVGEGGRRGALRLVRVAEQQLGGGAGRALRRREVRELHGAVHGLELAQQLLGGRRLRRVRERRRHGQRRQRLHALRHLVDVLEDGQFHLLLQPVGENVFCKENMLIN